MGFDHAAGDRQAKPGAAVTGGPSGCSSPPWVEESSDLIFWDATTLIDHLNAGLASLLGHPHPDKSFWAGMAQRVSNQIAHGPAKFAGVRLHIDATLPYCLQLDTQLIGHWLTELTVSETKSDKSVVWRSSFAVGLRSRDRVQCLPR